MLDDFFVRALVAAAGVAAVAGPLGCFVVWRRMAYFGDTISHAALLGVAFAFLFEINLTLGVFAVSASVGLALVGLSRRASLPADTLLGIMAHGGLAVGLVVIGFLSSLRIDLMGYLFGDILAVSRADIVMIYAGGAAVLVVLVLIWRSLLAGTVSVEIAHAERLAPERARLVYVLILAAVVAAALKIVGAILITALLIIPPAAARRFATTPEAMAVLSAVIGAGAALAGLAGSLALDTPSGPSIVVAALSVFVITLLPVWPAAWFSPGGRVQ